MPMRGGSPSPPKRKKMRSPPPGLRRQQSDEGKKTRSSGRAPSPFVTPLEIPGSSRGSKRPGGRESRASDRRLVSPRAGNWDDLSDTEHEPEHEPERREPEKHSASRSSRGSCSSRRPEGRPTYQTNPSAHRSERMNKWAGRTAVKQSSRSARFKEDDEREAEILKHHRMEVKALMEDAMHASLQAHDARQADAEHMKSFESHKKVFMLGVLLLVLPLTNLSVFAGYEIVAFPMVGIVYGLVCTAAAWHSHRPLLYAVAIGSVPMLARLSIAMYVLSVQTKRCREAEACTGDSQIGWFGLAAEMAVTLIAGVAAAHHLKHELHIHVVQERASHEAEEEKRRTKGVAELKTSLKKSFKAWGSELEMIFKDFDEDGNGMMDREELCKGLKTLGADFSDEVAGWLFDKIDVEQTGEIDYRTFASWFGTTKQAERAKIAELRGIHQEKVYLRWRSIYEKIKNDMNKKEQMAGIKSGRGQWDKTAIEACFDEFDDGDGELEVDELSGAFELLNMDPSDEEIEMLLTIYDADGSGTLDKGEFVRMLYDFIQSRDPPTSESEEEEHADVKPLGPDEDGTYPPEDGLLECCIIQCESLLSADSNGMSDPYVKVQLGANGNPRKTPVMAKTLDPIFAKKYQLKLRKLPRRVGDQVLRLTVYDFDRLDADDPLGQLELDMWQVFDKDWAQEIDQAYPLNDEYGDVGKSILKNVPDFKEHVYGTIRLRLSYASADYASDESFSDDDMDDDGNGSVLSPGVHKRKAGVEAGIVVVEQEVNSSDEVEEQTSEEEEDRQVHHLHSSSMVL